MKPVMSQRLTDLLLGSVLRNARALFRSIDAEAAKEHPLYRPVPEDHHDRFARDHIEGPVCWRDASARRRGRST